MKARSAYESSRTVYSSDYCACFLFGSFFGYRNSIFRSDKIRLKNMYSDGEEKAGEVLKVLENFDRFLVTALIW